MAGVISPNGSENGLNAGIGKQGMDVIHPVFGCVGHKPGLVKGMRGQPDLKTTSTRSFTTWHALLLTIA